MKRITKLLLLLIATLSVISGCKDELQSNMPELRRPDNKGNVIRASISSGVNSMRAFGLNASFSDDDKIHKTLNINWESDTWNNDGNKPKLVMCVYDKTAQIGKNGLLDNDKYRNITISSQNYIYKRAEDTSGRVPEININVDIETLPNIDENNQEVAFYLYSNWGYDDFLQNKQRRTDDNYPNNNIILKPLNADKPVDYDLVFSLKIPISDLRRNNGKIRGKTFKPLGTMILFDVFNNAEHDIKYPSYVKIGGDMLPTNNTIELSTGLNTLFGAGLETFYLDRNGKTTLSTGEHSYIYGIYKILSSKVPATGYRYLDLDFLDENRYIIVNDIKRRIEVDDYFKKMNGKVVSISKIVSKEYPADYVDSDYMITEWKDTDYISFYVGGNIGGMAVQYRRKGEQDWKNVNVEGYRIILDGLAPATYEVRTVGFTSFTVSRFASQYLSNVKQWGTSKFKSMVGAFKYCENMDITASDAPDLTECISLESTFENCLSLTGKNTDFSKWDTSNVKSMKKTFYIAEKGGTTRHGQFNGDVGSWKVGKVTTMEYMFRNQPLFSQDLSKWRPAEVTNFSNMFAVSSGSNTMPRGRFTSDLSEWRTPNATDMSYMFLNQSEFNSDLSEWDTSNVTDMSWMFGLGFNSGNGSKLGVVHGKFNGNVSTWNVSNVTNMNGMFCSQPLFNQDLSKWRPAKVRNFSFMFAIGTNKWLTTKGRFTSNLSEWETPEATRMQYMFCNQPEFNSNLNKFDTSNVTDMNSMFYISGTGATSESTQTYGKFNGNISSWNVSKVTDMSRMFYNQPKFNQNISSWTPFKVTDFSRMFAIEYKSGSFNQNLSSWVTPEATNMSWMFFYQGSFNSDLSGWNVAKVEKWKGIFDNSGVSYSHKPPKFKVESPE